MVRFLLFILIISNVFVANAQFVVEQGKEDEEKPVFVWTKKGASSLHLSQASYTNWTAGGSNSFSVVGKLRYDLNRKSDNTDWETYFDMALGTQNNSDVNEFRKTEDKFEFNTKYGVEMDDNLYLSVMLSVKSQFMTGYTYDGTNITKVSAFFAPGYITGSLGVDYKPFTGISIFMAPIAMRNTIVADQDLADEGAFGVDGAIYDPITGAMISPGSRYLKQLGLSTSIRYEGDIATNIKLKSKLDLFSTFKKMDEVAVNWDATLECKINKYITANVETGLIYDPNIMIAKNEMIDGQEVEVKKARVQFKESITLGFTVNW